ncbi:hypothetical protein [Aurantimonas marina]|uniref:hypothetical protein n=1 Tax=Aurantimonas marina TaxID=2780508 RepID=UPI0019D24BC9|nr:hypothetical protein [Aurantimonas marina]
MKTIFVAAALTVAALGAAHGAELKPLAAQSIELGQVTGAAYYTVEGDEFRVVTTLQAGEAGSALRFVSMLSDGEALTIQVPSNLGNPSTELVIERAGDAVRVSPAADLRASLALR